MKRRSLLGLGLLLTVVSLHAQRSSEWGFGTYRLESHRLQLNLLMPGFHYEFGLLPNLTVGAGVGLGLATPQEGYSLAPSYRAQSRYYTNLGRREDLGRNITGNSGDYLAATFSHFFTQWELAGNMDNSGRDLVFFGPAYGWQRQYKGGWSLNVELGAGWYFSNRDPIGLGPSVHLNLGWNPFARKKQTPVFPLQD